MTFDPDAELARLNAEQAQTSAAASGLAKILGEFREDLEANGFERSEALELVRDWFEDLRNPSRSED